MGISWKWPLQCIGSLLYAWCLFFFLLFSHPEFEDDSLYRTGAGGTWGKKEEEESGGGVGVLVFQATEVNSLFFLIDFSSSPEAKQAVGNTDTKDSVKRAITPVHSNDKPTSYKPKRIFTDLIAQFFDLANSLCLSCTYCVFMMPFLFSFVFSSFAKR